LCATELRLEMVEHRLLPRCPACAFTIYPDPKVAVSTIVEVERSLLLVQRKHHPAKLWCLPGGYVDATETPADAARREVYEETGLQIDVIKLVQVYGDTEAGVILIVYRSGPPTGTMLIDPDELLDARFFDCDRLPPACALAFVTGRAAILDWAKGYETPGR